MEILLGVMKVINDNRTIIIIMIQNYNNNNDRTNNNNNDRTIIIIIIVIHTCILYVQNSDNINYQLIQYRKLNVLF